MLTEYVPFDALEPAVSVNVAVPPEVTVAGLNDPVTPDGSPLTERVTDCGVPETVAVDTVTVSDSPGDSDSDVGVTAIEKSLGAAVTVIAPLTECDALAATPLTVNAAAAAAAVDAAVSVNVDELPEGTDAGALRARSIRELTRLRIL